MARPRIRTLKPELPQSESLSQVSRDARLLFLLLFTICDDDGRLRGTPRMLAAQLYPYDNDVSPQAVAGWLGELERVPCLQQYEAAGMHLIQILDFREASDIHPARTEWAQRVDWYRPSKLPPALDPIETAQRTPKAVSRENSRDDANASRGAPQSPSDRPSRALDSSRENPRGLDSAREAPRGLAHGAPPVPTGAAEGLQAPIAPDSAQAVETEPISETAQIPRENSRGLAPDLDPDLDLDLDPLSPSLARSSLECVSAFDRFWQGRAKRLGPDPREPARREFDALMAAGFDPDRIIAAEARYAEVEHSLVGTRFQPQTWKRLKQRTFEGYGPRDDLAAAKREAEAAAIAEATHAGPHDSRWTAVQGRLNGRLGPEVFAAWLARTRLGAIAGGTAHVLLPTRFLASYARDHYAEDLLAAIAAEYPDVERVACAHAASWRPPEPDREEALDDHAKHELVARVAAIVADVRGGKRQALGMVTRWLKILPAIDALARVVAHAGELKLSGQHAVAWIDQGVAAAAKGDTLPLGVAVVTGGKTRVGSNKQTRAAGNGAARRKKAGGR